MYIMYVCVYVCMYLNYLPWWAEFWPLKDVYVLLLEPVDMLGYVARVN